MTGNVGSLWTNV